MYACLYICMYVSIFVCMYLWMCVCMSVYIYIYMRNKKSKQILLTFINHFVYNW